MARPRVFVSSTFYDLKHIRSSLDVFIESLGFDSILSEKGDIAYAHDVPLDESCYREVATADIFVLIIGGRYGSSASREDRKPSRQFFERYASVTKLEHEEAIKRDVPVYILVESAVYAEYHTYLRNKDSTTISYAHVDSVNIFALLEEILSRRRNNPFQTFERFSDIERWLKEQWAGLFREFLHRTSSQQQLTALTDQVHALQDVAATLKRYLEEVVSKVSPEASVNLIQAEQARLESTRQLKELGENRWVQFVMRHFNVDLETVRSFLAESGSFLDFCKSVAAKTSDPGAQSLLYSVLETKESAREDFNAARQIIGQKAIRLKKRKTPNVVDEAEEQKDSHDQ